MLACCRCLKWRHRSEEQMFSPRSCYDILWGSRAVRASCRPHPRPHAEMPSLTRGCATALASHRSSKSEISIETGAKKEKKKCSCYKRIDISGSLGAQQSVTQKPKSGIPDVLATCLVVSSSLAVELLCKPSPGCAQVRITTRFPQLSASEGSWLSHRLLGGERCWDNREQHREDSHKP